MAFEWGTAEPEDEGFDRDALNAAADGLVAAGTKALLVIRNDRIVHEWYLDDRVRETGHYTASMAKALVGGTCMATAIGDGVIGLDDPASKFVPQWRDDPVKATITLRQLGSHTAGLDESKPKDQGGWQQAFWARNDPPDDPFTISRDTVPLIANPGVQFFYSNPGIAMFGYALTAALGQDLRSVLRDRVLRKIGVADGDWSCGYGQTFEVDGLPLVAAWGGGRFKARATARVGRLIIREGDWEGERVLEADAVRRTVEDAGLPNGNGQGWWTNARGAFPSLPKDACFASGAEHQTLLVVPSLRLILVRNGAALTDSPDRVEVREQMLFGPVMDALAL